MGTCGCSPKNSFYKLGDKLIIVEKYDGCDFCESPPFVMAGELTDEQKDCFGELENKKPRKLGKWPTYTGTIYVTPRDFKKPIKKYLSDAFETALCEDLTDKEFDKIPEKLLAKIEKKVTKRFVEML